MIEKYICDLLYKYDSIILPGFGTFIVKNFPASINSIDNSLTPPSSHIVFNAASKNNDGILANYISEKEKISFFEACNKILAFVEEINKSLFAGKHVIFQKIGTFTITADNIISFSPDISVNYNLDTFGMEEIKLPSISRADNKIKTTQIPETARSTSGKRKFPKVAIWIILIIVFLGGSISLILILKPDFIMNSKLANIFSSKGNNNLTIVQEKPKEKNKLTVKANLKKADTLKSQDSTKKVSDVNPIVNTEQTSTGNYYIISASFRIKENAVNYAQTLQQKSYDSKVIFLEDRGIYVVSYNAYSSEVEAEQALTKIKTENPVAWILKH
jgi:nucleoid DNA-binding protein